MDKQDIIRMAREASNNCPDALLEDDNDLAMLYLDELERFAALVVAAEREAILKLAETPIGEYEVVVACGTEPETKRIPRYLEGQFLIKAIRARGNT